MQSKMGDCAIAWQEAISAQAARVSLHLRRKPGNIRGGEKQTGADQIFSCGSYEPHETVRARRYCDRGQREGDNDRDPTDDQFGRQCGQPIVVTLRRAVFDRDVPAHDIPGIAQALVECVR